MRVANQGLQMKKEIQNQICQFLNQQRTLPQFNLLFNTQHSHPNTLTLIFLFSLTQSKHQLNVVFQTQSPSL